MTTPATPSGTLAALRVIRLDERVAECYVCGTESPPHWGIPLYEGEVMPNDWPGDWVGVDACQECWLHQGVLLAPVPLWLFRQAIATAEKEAPHDHP